MSLKKGHQINRESKLKDFIIKILKTKSNYYSVKQIRDLIISENDKLLAGGKDRASKTNIVRMTLVRLVKKNILQQKVFIEQRFYNKKDTAKCGKAYSHSVTKFIINN